MVLVSLPALFANQRWRVSGDSEDRQAQTGRIFVIALSAAVRKIRFVRKSRPCRTPSPDIAQTNRTRNSTLSFPLNACVSVVPSWAVLLPNRRKGCKVRRLICGRVGRDACHSSGQHEEQRSGNRSGKHDLFHGDLPFQKVTVLRFYVQAGQKM